MLKIAKFAILLALGCTAMFAQEDRGTIAGTIKDPTGAVVPNASVTATNTGTNNNFKTTSGAGTGSFTLPSLPGGPYRVRVEAPGFKAYVQEGITLAAGDTISLDVQLTIGAAAETVEVTGEVAQLETDTARVATEVTTKFVDELPLLVNGSIRSPIDLANTTTDVQGSSANFRIGGGQAGLEGMTLDGATVSGSTDLNTQGAGGQNSPSIDSLAEFSVESGGFKAETGHASGGSVSFVSKSGTNQLHGDLYEYFRNYDMDARTFFATAKTLLKQNDFGFVAGAPVIIPKIYNGKDKTFWFFSYEGFRNRTGASTTPVSVPAPAMYTGDFSQYVDQNNKQYIIYDPATQTENLTTSVYTRTPFPGNVIPQSRFDPIAVPILKYAQGAGAVPNIPNLVPGTHGYVNLNYRYPNTSGQRAPVDKWSVKFDHSLTKKQHLAMYYGRGATLTAENPGGYGGLGLTNGLPGALSGASPGSTYWRVYRPSWEYTISPTLFNRMTGGKTVNVFNVAGVGYVQGCPLSFGLAPLEKTGWTSQGIGYPNWPGPNCNFPQVSMNDFNSWGSQDTNTQGSKNWEGREDLTWVHGRHTFKFGLFYNNTIYDGGGSQNYSGYASFNTASTGVPNVTSQSTGGGSALASFELGQASGYDLDTLRLLHTHFINEATYVQDDWRISNKLTLNLGLRYEIDKAPTVNYDEQSDFSPTAPDPDAGGIPGALVFAGTGPGRTGSRSMVPDWDRGVSPRFGFAYAVNNKTTVRGSSSMTYGAEVQNANSTHNVGFIQRLTIGNTSQELFPTFILQNGAPAWAQVPNLDPGVGDGGTMPYYNGALAAEPSKEYNFALDIQRQITKTLAVDAGYQGTMAQRIESTIFAYNSLPYQSLPASLSPYTAAGQSLLNSLITSPAAVAAGIKAPFPGFAALWGTSATVRQALLPFPQYSSIDTYNGGGDKDGHSTYNAGNLKITKRFSHGFTMNFSYLFSKYFTNTAGGTESIYNWNLLKALSPSDETHQVKIIYTYDIPVGKGRQFLNKGGILDEVLGGWRIAGNNTYLSGTPISLTTTVSFNLGSSNEPYVNTPTITTYDGWGATYTGKFDPNKDKFFQPLSFFPAQPTTQQGNATRTNPKIRTFPTLNENISLAKSFRIHEQIRLELRGESFNVLNRVVFGAPNASLQNANFGLVNSQANSARQMQISMKLYF